MKQTIQDVSRTIEHVRERLTRQGTSVTVVAASYRERPGIVSTSASLSEGMQQLGLEYAQVFLSDSPPDDTTVDAASLWASAAGCPLVVDHSSERWSPKQALNVALASCGTDVVAGTNADIVVPAANLVHLVDPICTPHSGDVVVGVATPNPSLNGVRHRAWAFRVNAVRGLMANLSGSSIRAQGALWAAHRQFYAQWQFQIGRASITDDVDLACAVEARRSLGLTVADAGVFKVPPGTIRDFYLQTRRPYFAMSATRPSARNRAEWRAFGAEPARDPLGAVPYSGCRVNGPAPGPFGDMGAVSLDQAGNDPASGPGAGKGETTGSSRIRRVGGRRATSAYAGAGRFDAQPAGGGLPTRTDPPKLSAVIVHYNDPENLVPCLDALRRDPGIAEIVVIDNASDPGAVAVATGTCSDVRLVLSPVNLGFGGGANLGAAHCAGDLLVFLNPDTVPEPGCMEALATHLSEHGGVVGPQVRNGPDRVPEYGCRVDRMLLPRLMEQPGEPLYVMGCCLAATRSCFDTVGGFDDRYFLFQEDVELCWQALRRGLSVEVLPSATVLHAGGAAAAGGYHRNGLIETTSSRILLRERNGWAVILACAPASRIPLLLALSIVRTFAFSWLLLRVGRPRDVAKLWGGLPWNIVHLRATLERRRYRGVTSRAEKSAWSRVARQFFLWDLARRGERLRFVDKNTVGVRS